MSSANFNEMTQGINQKAIQDLFDEIHTVLIKDAEKKLMNELKNVEKSLEAGWEGQDREVFVSNLKNLATKIVETLKKYDEAIAGCFQQLITDWVDFQSKNVVAK